MSAPTSRPNLFMILEGFSDSKKKANAPNLLNIFGGFGKYTSYCDRPSQQTPRVLVFGCLVRVPGWTTKPTKPTKSQEFPTKCWLLVPSYTYRCHLLRRHNVPPIVEELQNSQNRWTSENRWGCTTRTRCALECENGSNKVAGL